MTRIIRSGRAALSVLQGRDILFIVTAVVVATLLSCALLVAQVDAARARSQSVDLAQAQRDQAIDTRQAQTRRIDELTDEIAGLRQVVEDQARTIGRQEQAIRDLAAQVSSGGQDPVATAVSPRRQGTRTPAPTSGTKPTTQPMSASSRPPAVVRPAPSTTTEDDGLICSLLVLVC